MNVGDVGNILDAVTKRGVNKIDNIALYVDDAQLQAAQVKALRLAADDAVAQAKVPLLAEPYVHLLWIT